MSDRLQTGVPGARAEPPRRRLGVSLLIALATLLPAAGIAGFVISWNDLDELVQSFITAAQVRRLEKSLLDTETGVRGYLLTGRPEYLEPYIAAERGLAEAAKLLPQLDAYDASLAPPPDRPPFSRTLSELQASFDRAVNLTQDGKAKEADVALQTGHAKEMMDRLRRSIDGYLATIIDQIKTIRERIRLEGSVSLAISLLGALTALIALLQGVRQAREREAAIRASLLAREQIEQLFAMTDMLQSTTDREDANEVLRAAAAGLLPDLSGALYLFNSSRDRLDLSTRWGPLAKSAVDHVSPTACWALKRGKPHVNLGDAGRLRCHHASPDQVSLEVPISARGQLYGLIEIMAAGAGAEARLGAVRPVATAMGDAMSLALSSIALRERLSNQALRDGLTGLYNRRFLEEMLDRLCLDGERRNRNIALIMIDMDHFKQLNDEHGHAAGDAVLREVASVLIANLRTTDIACRYGGEELAVLLPDTSVGLATAKAEQIRRRIAELSDESGARRVTASLGVAAIPDTSMRPADLFAAADAALYTAKQQGRDRVAAAPLRPAAQAASNADLPQLAAAE